MVAYESEIELRFASDVVLEDTGKLVESRSTLTPDERDMAAVEYLQFEPFESLPDIGRDNVETQRVRNADS